MKIPKEKEVIMLDSSSEINSVRIRIPKSHIWKPKEDITTYELALCLPVLTGRNWYNLEYFIEALPESARCHFEQSG